MKKMRFSMETLGIIELSVLYNINNPYQPHAAKKLYLHYSDISEKYTLNGYDVKGPDVEQMFWIDNAAHASFGLRFLDQVIASPKTAKQDEYWSCGEGLHLNYIPNVVQ